MQTTWSWTNKRSNEGAKFAITHLLTGKRHGASVRSAPAVAGGLATARSKSHAFNTSDSVPVQSAQGTTPTVPVGDNWAAAREAFLTTHGPRAPFPRRPALSKELRKALLATEMAAWEAP